MPSPAQPNHLPKPSSPITHCFCTPSSSTTHLASTLLAQPPPPPSAAPVSPRPQDAQHRQVRMHTAALTENCQPRLRGTIAEGARGPSARFARCSSLGSPAAAREQMHARCVLALCFLAKGCSEMRGICARGEVGGRVGFAANHDRGVRRAPMLECWAGGVLGAGKGVMGIRGQRSRVWEKRYIG